MSRKKKLVIWAAVAVCAPAFIGGMISGAKQATTTNTSSAQTAAAPAASTAAPKPAPKAAPTSARPTAVSASDPAVIDAAFAGTVISDDPGLQQYGFSQLAQAGRQICTDVRGGTSVQDEATQLMGTYGAKGAGVLLGVAPDAYCKDLKPSIEQQLQALR